jgi:sterol desaturase/sphingolipid hydroxylase (fatty acid hydroxylase superfamily)
MALSIVAAVCWSLAFLGTVSACELFWPLLRAVPTLPRKTAPSENFRVGVGISYMVIDAMLRMFIMLWATVDTVVVMSALVAATGTLATMYAVHALQHRLSFLRWCHGVHHQWVSESTSTDALQAFHEHPVDLILEVVATMLAAVPLWLSYGGAGLWNTTAVAMGLRTITAIITHSRVEQLQHHGLHHMFPYKNYSSLRILDSIFQTQYRP